MRFLLSFLLLAMPFFVQSQRHNLITNYPPEVTGSGIMVYSIAADDEGILYFGISKGVLVYDGDSWESYDLSQKGEARSVEFDKTSGRIYVGGLSYFGYLEKDRHLRYRYVSLSDSIVRHQPFREVWQVLVKSDSILFQSNEGYFVYSNEHVSFLPIKKAYMFQSGSRVYLSQLGGNLMTLSGSRIDSVWSQKDRAGEAAYSIMPFNGHDDLLVYPRTGAVLRNFKTGKVTPFVSGLTELCKKHWVYLVMPLTDSLLAVDTWEDGVFITDRTGNVLHRFDHNAGLQGIGIYDMHPDRHGRLWLAMDYGISVISLRTILQTKTSLHPSRVASVEAGGGPRHYVTGPHDTIRFDRIPGHLEFLFSHPQLEYYAQKEFRYRLEGHEEDWNQTKGNMAEYRNLSEGSYIFHVQTADGASSVGRVVIHIDSPWYARFEGPAGYTLLGMILLAMIALLVVLWARQARRTLNKLVGEKTSEIERTKQELIQSNLKLRETNDELDTFLYRSSHDLVAPMKSIRGLIQLMRMSPADREKYMVMMEDRILKLENLLHEINNYLKYTRQGDIMASFRPAELTGQIWSEIEFMDKARAISLVREVDDELELNGDPNAWRMILVNLLSNAIKYHDFTKPDPFIRLRIAAHQGSIQLTVEDNGQGIAKKSQDRLFEMFYRAHETSSGSGLGLFLVKRMVDRLNGTIRIQSDQGKGTTVIIVVPAPGNGQPQPSESRTRQETPAN